MDYVDDELSEKTQSEFIAHADECPSCRRELKEVLSVRKLLADLPTVTVSSEFDFKLKASLRLEDVRLRSPFYRFRLLVRDNLASIVAVPAAAALLVMGAIYYHGTFQDIPANRSVVEQQMPVKNDRAANLSGNIQADNVTYVLESLDIGEFGIEVSPQRGPVSQESNLNTVSLIIF
jgi:anti-sigma factor RsiW